MCNHYFVDGFGGMGDAAVCKLCGLDKYPEAIPLLIIAAKVQGRFSKEGDPLYQQHVKEAQEARERRNASQRCE